MYDHSQQRQALKQIFRSSREHYLLDQHQYDEWGLTPEKWWEYTNSSNPEHYKVVANCTHAPAECLVAIYGREECERIDKLMLAINPGSPNELLLKMIADALQNHDEHWIVKLLRWILPNPNLSDQDFDEVCMSARKQMPHSDELEQAIKDATRDRVQ